jgi:hypothetical protein
MFVVYEPNLWIDGVVPGLRQVEFSYIRIRARFVTHPVFLAPML